jgi:hypothetical protein
MFLETLGSRVAPVVALDSSRQEMVEKMCMRAEVGLDWVGPL